MLQNKWFDVPKSNETADLRLFCFPYAGGSSLTYRNWEKHLPSNIELVNVQPPGRNTRMFEPAYSDMPSLVEDLMNVFPQMLDKPYILFGHSLGSRIAFELMSQLNKQKLAMPLHFIASGSRGPHNKSNKARVHALSDDEFIQELKQLNGTPAEVLENSELMKLFLPLLRADFELSASYSYSGTSTFDCPLSVFGGQEDIEISLKDLQSWGNYFTPRADVHIVPGNHFFIENNRQTVLDKLNKIIHDSSLKLQMRYKQPKLEAACK